MSFHAPEKYRIHGYSDSNDGNNGVFRVQCNVFKPLTNLAVIASDGANWDHVSVSVIGKDRCPTWEEMCFVKNLFWDEDDCIVQFHPPKSEYINNHKYCLHLWRNQLDHHKTPPKILVGI